MKDTRKTSRPKSVACSLPIELWPVADRTAWKDACRPSVRLKRGGAASRLRPVTQRELAKRYGLFLNFLWRLHRLDQNSDVATHVTLENVKAYVVELQRRVGSVTVYGSIQKLRRTVQLIAPHRDLDWLIAIERELASEMRPISKWDRVVYTDVLADAGHMLMVKAESAKRPEEEV